METVHPAPPATGRILRFQRPDRPMRTAPLPSQHFAPGQDASPVESFGKYEGPEEAEDYRRRQVANLAAFAACALLIVAGVWIATTMADIQRNQNCVLSGGKNCAQISIKGIASR
jgi:hypothetical protein